MRVVIAEDSAILRQGLTQLLESRGIEVVAAVGDAESLLDVLRRCSDVADDLPDIAIIDVRMPPNHTDEGLRAAIAIRESMPQVAVMVFSQYVETRYARDLLSGDRTSVGYLLKDRVSDIDAFVEALERVSAGGTALDPEVVHQLFGSSPQTRALQALTPREREVLSLMAEGKSNAGIARQLVLSQRSVETHVANIFSKLDLGPDSDGNRRVLAVLRYLT